MAYFEEVTSPKLRSKRDGRYIKRYVAGAEAFHAGKPDSACPYQLDDVRSAWLEGYRDALLGTIGF